MTLSEHIKQIPIKQKKAANLVPLKSWQQSDSDLNFSIAIYVTMVTEHCFVV